MSAPAVTAQPARRMHAGVMLNTAILAGYSVAEAGIVFVFTIVVARYLGATDFGRLGFALSYALLFSMLADPGISLAITKLVATSQGEAQARVTATGLSLRLLLSGGVLLVSLVPFGFSAYMRANWLCILLIVISEHLRNLAIYLCFVFRGHHQNKYEPVSLGLERVLCLIAGVLALRAGFGLTAIAWVYLGARAASLMLAFTMFVTRFGWHRLNLDRGDLASIKSNTAPLAVLMMCERVNMYLPPVLVTWFAGEYATGLFQAAFKAIMPAFLLSTAVAGGLYAPMASRFTSDPKESARLYRAGVRGLLHLLLPAAAVTLFMPVQLMHALYGEQYLASAPVLQVLTPYYLAIVFIAVNHLFMPAIEQQRVLVRVSLVSVALNAGLAIAFTLGWGARGAATALAVAQGSMAVLYSVLAAKLGNARFRWADWFTLMTAFAASLVTVGMLHSHFVAKPFAALLQGGVLSAAAYSAVLLALGGLSDEEKRAFRAVGRKLLPA